MSKEWQTLAFMPKSINKLIEAIKTDQLKVVKNNKIEKQLINYANYHDNKSSSFKAAQYIFKLALEDKIKHFEAFILD